MAYSVFPLSAKVASILSPPKHSKTTHAPTPSLLQFVMFFSILPFVSTRMQSNVDLVIPQEPSCKVWRGQLLVHPTMSLFYVPNAKCPICPTVQQFMVKKFHIKKTASSLSHQNIDIKLVTLLGVYLNSRLSWRYHT